MKLPDILLDKDKIDLFHFRTGLHIDLVQSCMRKVIKHLLRQKSDILVPELISRGLNHDRSKYYEPEYTGYVWLTDYYHAKKSGEEAGHPYLTDKEISRLVQDATYHHIKSNDHHPEYYNYVTSMEYPALIEMVCDWTAMDIELSNGKSNSAYDWANKNIGTKWKFSKQQVEDIYHIISIVSNENN